MLKVVVWVAVATLALHATAVWGATPAQEKVALDKLYTATNGAQWTNNTGWLAAAANGCDYYGVTCSGSQVVGLDLYANGLTGTLPDDATVWIFASMTTLRVGSNSIGGTLPASLSQLSALTLLDIGTQGLPNYLGDLGLAGGGNVFTGTVPASWAGLTALESLSLKRAGVFEGELPDLSALVNLQHLYLTECGFSGPLPEWLATMPMLSTLMIEWNGFTSLPAALATSSVRLLGASENPFEFGPFPEWILSWTTVNELHLSHTGLTGTLPAGVGSLPLISLGVVGNELEGTIPPEVFTPTMFMLALHQNKFVGDVPETVSNSPGLFLLAISEMPTLTGTIPSTIGSSPVYLLFLNENGLTGTIPATMGSMTFVSALRLERNALEGTIPASLAGLVIADEVWLYGNSLNGSVPAGVFPATTDLRIFDNELEGSTDFLCSMPNLVTFQASRNKFSSVASCVSGATLPAIVEFDMSYNELSGQVPVEVASLATVRTLDLSHNSLSSTRLRDEFAGMTALRTLRMGYNSLVGPVSDFLRPLQLLVDLTMVDFTSNELSGGLDNSVFTTLEAGVTFFPSLTFMRLDNNNVTGTVPKFVGEMPALFEFAGRNNDFEGELPSTLVTLGIASLTGNPKLVHSTPVMPSWMAASFPFVQPEGALYSCPTFGVAGDAGVVSFDASYFGGAYCKCEPGTAGVNASCVPCASFGAKIKCVGGEVELNGGASGSVAADVVVRPANLTISPGWYPLEYQNNVPVLEKCYQIRLGRTACNPDGQHPFQCLSGYEGRLCSRCAHDFYSKSRRCSACISVVPVVIAVVYGMLFLAWYLYTISVAMPGFYAPTIKSLFIFLQTSVVLVTETTVLAWPTNVTALFDGGLSWATFSIGMLHCLKGGGSPFATNMVLQAAFVPAIFALTLLTYGVVRVVALVKGSDVMSLTEWEWRSGAIRVVLAVLNLGYLPIAVGVLSALFCAQPDALGKSYLFAAPWIECSFSSSEYRLLFGLGMSGVVLYAVGIPLVFLVLLFYFRAPSKRVVAPEESEGLLPSDHILLSRHGTVTDDWLGFLYYSYSCNKFWYELVILVRRLLIALLAVMPSDSTPMPLYALLITLVASLCVHIYLEPFRNHKINLLEAAALTQLVVTFSCGLIFSSSSFVGDSEAVLPLEIVLIMSNVLVIALFVYALVWFMNRSCNSSVLPDDEDSDVMREMLSARSHTSAGSADRDLRSRAPVAEVVNGSLAPPRARPHPAILPPLQMRKKQRSYEADNGSELTALVDDDDRRRNGRQPGRPPQPRPQRPVVSGPPPRTISGPMAAQRSSSAESFTSSEGSASGSERRPRRRDSRSGIVRRDSIARRDSFSRRRTSSSGSSGRNRSSSRDNY